MQITHNIVDALTSFITATGTQDRAILIGGQAIRDWHAAQVHALTGTAMTLPVPRATTDMDVHLLIEKEERADVARAIEADWTPSPDLSSTRVFQFTWRHDAAITLDLIATTDAQARDRVQFFAKLGTGTDIGAVRVLEPWIIRHHLHERCFSPPLAQLRIRRLNRLGLAASKAGAIGVTIDELITAAREAREPQAWTRRLDKDLQDLDLLLQPMWIDSLWEPQYEEAGDEIQRAWQATIEPLIGLRSRPRLMPLGSYESLGRTAARLPRDLLRVRR
jgi:hypothetical protein